MKYLFCLALFCMMLTGIAQTPAATTSSELLLQLRKLNQLGSVLYVAAHPDDENTRLLAFLANEKQYRTGYLSLTRGDGGQNLIGDEQGIDLGLIRTQELLAAGRIDGAEQYFTRAFDFGFCKSPEEALSTWDHEKILADVVWVVRKFRPDVIIARFPEDSRAGHGHHAASGILAREAFDAAADPTRFPEQLQQGVTVWQAKRMLWNTYNFGSGIDTRNESQFKTEVGMYNPFLGRSYGEIASLSRSQHKSQGFGVPAQRGSLYEYFETIRGDQPAHSLLDGVETGWRKIPFNEPSLASGLQLLTEQLITDFRHDAPQASLPGLLQLRAMLRREMTMEKPRDAGAWQKQHLIRIKLEEVNTLIFHSSGLFAEAVANSQLTTIGDTISVAVTINNRLGVSISGLETELLGQTLRFNELAPNQNKAQLLRKQLEPSTIIPQPYWLEYEKLPGSFTVNSQQRIGLPQVNALEAVFRLLVGNDTITLTRPVLYKFTDPVKGEKYHPVQLVDPLLISSKPSLLVLRNGKGHPSKKVVFTLQANQPLSDTLRFSIKVKDRSIILFDSLLQMKQGEKRDIIYTIDNNFIQEQAAEYLSAEITGRRLFRPQVFALARISYDHIPDIFYHYVDGVKLVRFDLKTAGKQIGYIPGAGDKVPQALEQMGYAVTLLNEEMILAGNLQHFDAIVTGIRAYNTNSWMENVHASLMQYVQKGGVLVTQYNTNNFISTLKGRIGPFPFSIGRNRVTDEHSKVEILQPQHPVFNYPNRITSSDFEGWVQERSVYHAEKADSSYQRLLRMGDAGEKTDDGSLLVADYGKGRFVYTGLVFFRQLPAGVPGGFRLWANLLAAPVNNGKP